MRDTVLSHNYHPVRSNSKDCRSSESEMAALELTFPEAAIYICEEQAWTQWVQDLKHALSQEDAEQ